jgi:hypothetical protein
VVPAEQVAREREAIREATADHLAGVSFQQIANRWNQAGMPTAMGNAWTSLAVRDVLIRPMNVGVVEHDGAPVGRIAGGPIVDEQTFERIRAKVAARRRGRMPKESYVATGVLRCGVCGHKLSGRKTTVPSGRSQKRYYSYYCPKIRHGCGQISISMQGADAEIEKLVVARLSDPEHAAQVRSYTTGRAQRLAEVREAIADAEELSEALSERLGRLEITLTAFDRANKPLAQRLAGLREERTSLESGELGPVNTATAQEIQAEWDDADPVGRRTMLVRALGRWLLVVDAPVRAGRGFDRERMRLVPPDTDPTSR